MMLLEKGEVMVQLQGAIKKIAEGAMFVSALLMATPLNALACTQIYVGSKYTETGDTFVGRSEDYAARYSKFFGIQEPMVNPTYISDESGFNWTYEGTSFRYTYVRDSQTQWNEIRPYSEAGTNEKGVSVSATESTSMNSKIKSVDPLSLEGIGEFNIPDVVLGTSSTAREGVQRLGSLIDDYGSSECNQIIIADNSETWIFMQLSGHQWMAIVMPDDVVSVNPNMSGLQFEVDLDDASTCLHSAGLESIARSAGSYVTFDDGTMNVAASYGTTGSGSPRYVQGHLYFGDEMVEGEDYTVSGSRVTGIADTQLMFKPGSSNVPISLMTALRSFAARGEQSDSPAVNANLGASGAIGGQGTTEAHMFQIRKGLTPDIATIEWIALSPAEFNVFLPVYGSLLTELDKTFYPTETEADVSHEREDPAEDTDSTYLDYIFMDINTLANEHRDTMAEGVRGYLDAIQKSIIDQQDLIDKEMQDIPAGESRNDLANRSFDAVSTALYSKASTLLDEMRAFIRGKGADQFVPSDYDPETGTMRTPLAYVNALSAPTITAQPVSASYVQGDDAQELSVAASAAYDDGSLTYQWYVADGSVPVTEGLDGFVPVQNGTSAVLPVDTALVGSKTYVVVVKNSAGLTVTSDAAVIDVAERTTGQVPGGSIGFEDGTGENPSGTGADDTVKSADAEGAVPGDASKGHLPSTGDASQALFAVAAVGAICIAGGATARRRRS